MADGFKTGGRKKGTPNKATSAFREAVAKVLEDNGENIGRWLSLVAEGDGTDHGKPDPAKALDLVAKLAEYAAPKLSRSEVDANITGELSIADAVRSFHERRSGDPDVR